MTRIVSAIGDLQLYKSPFFLPFSGILQTVYSEIAAAPVLQYQRQELPLAELPRPVGASCCPSLVPPGLVSVDLLPHENPAGAVVLVPGLTGSSDSGFIRRAAALCHQHGFEVWAYNPRGRGGNKVLSPFLYSAGYTEDLKRAIDFVASRTAGLPLFAMGYSLGSNKLAKLLGECSDQCNLTAAVCLACPVDLVSTSNALQQTWGGRLLDKVLVSFVQGVRVEHADMLGQHEHIDMEALAAAQTMAQFDHEAIAPMFEFSCASEYYRHASSGLHLSRIRVPTMFLHANNDPIIPGHCIRIDDFESNPNLLNVMTRDGGHSMDWFQGAVKPESWGCRMSLEFFKSVIAEQSAHPSQKQV